MTQLSVHFSLEEFIMSSTGERAGIDNMPANAVFMQNLQRTAEVMEQVRALLGKPIIITSGYRCPALNKLVGGAYNSAHISGLAADSIAPQFGTPRDVCQAILPYLESLGIDQIIYEFTWTHIGLSAPGVVPRHQVLTLIPGGGYKVGIA